MENGITIGLGNNIDGKCMDWHNFDVITVDDIKRIIIVYAFGKPSIWTEIFAFQGKRNECVIKNVQCNKSNNTYSIYFNDNINNIDKNWHEKIYDTFVERPLISQYENIKIHIKNKQIKFKQQLRQNLKSLEKMCDFIEKYKGNKFDTINFAIKIEMMQQQNMKHLKQILVGTQDLVNKIKIMENERKNVNKDELEIKHYQVEEKEVKNVKTKNLLAEKESEESVNQVKNVLNNCIDLKKRFENRRKEVEENISILKEIEKIESSMNSQIVQGFKKENEKEEEREKQFQMVVNKARELLHKRITNTKEINTMNDKLPALIINCESKSAEDLDLNLSNDDAIINTVVTDETLCGINNFYANMKIDTNINITTVSTINKLILFEEIDCNIMLQYITFDDGG